MRLMVPIVQTDGSLTPRIYFISSRVALLRFITHTHTHIYIYIYIHRPSGRGGHSQLTSGGTTMDALQLLAITTLTMGRILLCTLAGFVVARYLPGAHESIKGLSSISVLIFLPCLLFSNLVLSITWEKLEYFYWAPLLACLPATLGLVCSFLLNPLFHPEWRSVLLLGCVFQNGITVGLSVILSLRGVSWLTQEKVERAQSYIFLYNIPCSLGLWAIGEPLIRSSKRKLVQEQLEIQQRRRQQEEQQARLNGKRDDSLYIDVVFPCRLEGQCSRGEDGVAPASGVPLQTGDEKDLLPPGLGRSRPKTSRRATAEEQLEWYRPSSNVPEASITDLGFPADSSAAPCCRHLHRLAEILWTPPIFSTLAAIVISLLPPLRWMAESPPGGVIIGAMKIIGEGIIPLQLLVLGCTVANARLHPADTSATTISAVGDGEKATRRRGTETGKEYDENSRGSYALGAAAAGTYMRCLPISQPTVFALSTILVRLFLIPTVCFVVIHFLHVGGVIPSDQEFLLSILLGTCAPSAINSSLICSMHDYKVRPYAQMIFTMYIATIGTTAIWLVLYIWYLGY